MAIDPSRGTPKDAATVSTLQSTTEESAKQAMRAPVDVAWMGARTSFLDNILKAIGDILGGAIQLGVGALQWIADGVINLVGSIAAAARGLLPSSSPFAPIQEAFQDGQKEIQDRIDLLPEGYCSAYMNRNVNMQWGSDGDRLAPFRAQLGPAINARIDAARSCIVFEKTGTWTVHLQVAANGTSYPGHNGISAELRTWRPDGSLYSVRIVRASPGPDEWSLTLSQPVVIPEPGYYTDVLLKSGRWRWWPGGTRWSGLTVIRSDSRIENPGSETVGDEVGPVEITEGTPNDPA